MRTRVTPISEHCGPTRSRSGNATATSGWRACDAFHSIAAVLLERPWLGSPIHPKAERRRVDVRLVRHGQRQIFDFVIFFVVLGFIEHNLPCLLDRFRQRKDGAAPEVAQHVAPDKQLQTPTGLGYGCGHSRLTPPGAPRCTGSQDGWRAAAS